MKGKILTAIILLWTSVFSMPVSAQDFPEIYIDAGYGGENEIAEVMLNVSGNTGMSAYSIEVDYDPSALRFVEAVQGDAVEGGVFYCNGDYDENAVRVVWSTSRDKMGDGTLAVLRFKTANGTAESKTAFSIGHSVIGNEDFEELEFSTESGELKIGESLKKGDVNLDGNVDIADVVWLNGYLLNPATKSFNYTVLGNAEVSGDNRINISDSALLINHVTMLSEVM